MAKELAGATEAKVSGSAKALMQEAATEFVCFVMSEANDQAAQAVTEEHMESLQNVKTENMLWIEG